MKVAIIGGGIAGLAAAYELAHAGIDFTLFEATSRLGGIVETVRRDGFVVECGPDSWVTEKPWAHELAIELGLANEIIPSNDAHRRTYIVRDGDLIPMPDGMRMMVPTKLEPLLTSPLFSAQAVDAYRREPERAEELKAAALPENQDESVASFVRRHFGDEVTHTLAAPLLSGVFGGDVERLSARAVMPMFLKMERAHGSLIAALQKNVKEATGWSIFTTLKSGLQSLTDGMAAKLPRSSVRLNTRVVEILQKDRCWKVRAITNSEKGDTEAVESNADLLAEEGCFHNANLRHSTLEEFDAVILAAPADTARDLLAPFDPQYKALLSMDASSAIVVALAFDAISAKNIRIPEGFGFLVPQTAVPDSSKPDLLACTFVDQKFSDRAPEGAVLLRGFFGGEIAPHLLHLNDEELAMLTRNRLSSLVGALPEPSFHIVRRWPRSLPQYAVGHLERMADLETRLRTLPGLFLIGNAYHGVGLPDLVREGRRTASRVTSEI